RRGKYVDPDFFIMPTARLTEMLAKVLESPEPMKLDYVPDPNDPEDVEDAWSDEAYPGKWIGPPAENRDEKIPIRNPLINHQVATIEKLNQTVDYDALYGVIVGMEYSG